MVTKARHALTKAEYLAEGPDLVRVVDGDKWGLFDRHGGWLEGAIRECDPQLCIWLTGIFVVQERTNAAAKAQEMRK
jgi:hypothetical protein